MADTCYGQPDAERPELSTSVADAAGDVVMQDAAPADAPASPVAQQPPEVQAGSPAVPTASVEAAAGPSTTPLSSGPSAPAAGVAEPRLALEQMTPVVDRGILMIFGPEGDPVPPQAFVDAAVLRPDLRLKLPDGEAVRAGRIAAVLGAQMLGRLDADEQSDAWILMMLGRGDGPEPASDDALHAEQSDDPEPAAGHTRQVGGGQAGGHTHPAADHRDQPGVVSEAGAGDHPVERPGAGAGAEAGAEASRHGIAEDLAPLDQARHPIVEANQDALPRVELDLDNLVDITESTLDFDLDLDFATGGLDLSSDRLDGEADDRSGIGREGAGDDASPAMTGQPDGQRGYDVPDQMPEAAQSTPPRAADPVGQAAQSGSGAEGLIAETGADEGLPGDAYPDDGPDAGAAVEAVRAVETVETTERGPVARQHDYPTRRADVGPRAGWSEPEREPAGISTQGASGQVDVDPDSIALVVIRGVPEDAMLSTGTRDEDGSWSISPLDLASVVISLAQDPRQGAGDGPGVEGDLDITGIAITEQGELVEISETVPLADYVAQSPTGQGETIGAAAAAVVPTPPMIALNIDPGVWAGEQFDALVIRDVPPGSRLSAGSYDPSIDGWVLMLQDLPTLAIAPPADLSTDFTLTLMGVALRPGDGNAARVLTRLPVTLG